MSDESMWMERAQSAEAKLATLRDSMDRIKADARHVLETFGARKQHDGTFRFDFARMIKGLGADQALELRLMIDDMYLLEGEPGEKPRHVA